MSWREIGNFMNLGTGIQPRYCFCCWNFVEKQRPGVSSWKIQTQSHVPKIWLSIPLHLFSKILESNNNTGLSDSLFLWFSWLVLQPSSIHLSWDGVFQQLKDSPFQLCYWFDFLVFLQIDITRRSYQTQLGQRNPNRLNVQLEHLAFFFGSLPAQFLNRPRALGV